MKIGHHFLALFILLHVMYMCIVPFPDLPYGVQKHVRSWGADYAAMLGTTQTWRMFSGPSTKSGRLEIAIKVEDGKWETLYRERSTKYKWKAERLDHYRWREKIRQFHDKRKTTAFRLFCTDLAKEAFDDFDSAQSVRFRITKGRAPKPAPGKKRWTTFDQMVQERIIKRGNKK